MLAGRIEGLSGEFGPDVLVLMEASLYNKLRPKLSASLRVLEVPNAPFETLDAAAEPGRQEQPDASDIAYLQLTSDSTSESRAVAVTHANVLDNVAGIRAACDGGVEEYGFSWLPLYHDMGLAGAELFCVCNSYPLTLMTPYDFVKRPLRWPGSISDFKCTLSPAPNFGYDYCARMVSAEAAARLNLSSWRAAFTGAEPIRLDTLERFARLFSAAGFRPQSFLPCYGMAEVTCAVTIYDAVRAPSYLAVERNSIGVGQTAKILGEGRVAAKPSADFVLDREAVVVFSVGRALPKLDVAIADEQGVPINDEQRCGEITVKGDSVVKGYTDGGVRTIRGFQDGLIYTGDLGFILNGELYVVERLKNIIIRNGQNYFTSALEARLAKILDISPDQVVIFQTDIHDPDSEVVGVIEVRSKSEPVETPLQEAVLSNEIPVNRLIFTERGGIPRTTSGKKRHFLCRKLLTAGEIKILHEVRVQ